MRFSVIGIPVRVDASFWIVMGLFGLQRATLRGSFDAFLLLEWVAMVFVGILVHELGHAVAFRSFGREPEVTLYAMGGLTSASGRLTPGRRLVSTLAGPAVGLVIGALALVVVSSGLIAPLAELGELTVRQQLRLSLASVAFDSVAEIIYLDLLFINVGWGLLNLIPLFPLDGGQSLEALLQIFRVPQAERLTSGVSLVIAVLGGLWAAQSGQIFLLLIAGFLGLVNLRRLRSGGAAPAAAGPPGAARTSPELQRTLSLAEQALSQGRPAEAVELVAQERALRPSPVATRAYAAVLARTRHVEGIETLLAEDGADQLDANTLTVLAAALVAGGRYESGLRAAESAWSADPDGHWQHAVTAAAARAGLRDVDGALRWLYTAASRGWDDERRLASDPLLAEVRADPRIDDLLARMRGGVGGQS